MKYFFIFFFILNSLAIQAHGLVQYEFEKTKYCTDENYLNIAAHRIEEHTLVFCEDQFSTDKESYVSAISNYKANHNLDDADLLFYNRHTGATRMFKAKPTAFVHIGYYIETNDTELLNLILDGMQTLWSQEQVRSYVNHITPLGFSISMYPVLYNKTDPNNAEMILALCRAGVDFNIHSGEAQPGLPAPSPIPAGFSPLYTAIFAGAYKTAKQMMDCGADVTFVDPYTQESLAHLVARSGNWEFWSYLLEAGSPIDGVTKKGETVLRYAYKGLVNYQTKQDHHKIISDLKERGITKNLDSKNKFEVLVARAEVFADEIRSASTERLKEDKELKSRLFAEIVISLETVERAKEEVIQSAVELCEKSGYSVCKYDKDSIKLEGLDDNWGRVVKIDSNSKKTLLLRKVRTTITVQASE